MLDEWRERVPRPRLWAAAGVLALVAGVCGADAQSGLAPSPDAALAPLAPASGGYALGAGTQAASVRAGVDAAQRGDIAAARAIQASLTDPLARKLILWTMVDSAGSSVDFFTLDSAQRELMGWPRAARRQAVAEKAMEAASISPSAVIAWFATREPTTPEGAMALASAYQQSGRIPDAQALIRTWWRGKSFGPEAQAGMLARFGIQLNAEDHAARLSMLLYGGPSPSANALTAFVTPEQQALARARMALRGDRSDAMALAGGVPAGLQNDPGLAFDRARYLRKHNLDTLAVGYLRNMTGAAPSPEVASLIWAERRALLMSALRSGNPAGAYAAATNHGLTRGTDFTEAEFFAGWVALTRLKNPALADQHFARVEDAGATPITLSRAAYWRGRAAAARGDATAAQGFWLQGSKYLTAFYGQLSAEKAGITRISLGHDPAPSAADRARFESRELVRASRLLGDAGERQALRTMAVAAVDQLASPEELALLVDMIKLYGDQDLSMRVVRAGAQKGLILPERGYPVRTVAQGYGLAEPAFALSITRQESNFDPNARSSVGARGMMQLMPGTAASVARRIGVGYSPGRLDDATYNMQLGASYLGQITEELGGSYVMAAAGYNAGPGRARQWASDCGDPRQSSVDPADYIECIPFSETRNYAMRIMETLQVYRARLAGGAAPLTLTADLHRGGWVGAGGVQQASGLPSAPLSYGEVQSR